MNTIFFVEVADPMTRKVDYYFVESLDELVNYGKDSKNLINFRKIDRLVSPVLSDEKEG